MNDHEPTRMDRREAIKWVMAASATVSALNYSSFGAPTTAPGIGIGTDPNLLEPVVPWPRTLTPAQLRTVAALCDTIIPQDDRSPSASAVGVPDFLDEWVSAPYPEQQADREQILEGLEWLNAESKTRFKKEFAELAETERQQMCDDICHVPTAKREFKSSARFFAKFRNLTAGGFYTTLEGMKDIQYVGNVALETFEGPPPEVLKHLRL
jgi:hypothetical protein